MNIEDFKDYLLLLKDIPSKITVIIEPYLSIKKSGNLWYSYGFCYLTSSFLDHILIEGYKGKSEVEITIKEEKNKFIDLLHLQLDEVFSALGVKDIDYIYKPVTEYTLKE